MQPRRNSTRTSLALATLAALASLAAVRSFAVPSWAFPHATERAAAEADSLVPRHVPNSAAAYSPAQLADVHSVADWHPESHPPMPAIVSHGRKPGVAACAYCHLADGIGRPENAMLAGLPASYIAEQMEDMKSGARRSASEPYGPGDAMRRVAENATAQEVAEAAAYFSRLRARPRSQVVEATQIPRPIPWDGLYFRDSAGGTDSLGDRLVEMATDRARHELHDPMAPYVAYVPPGSVARGRTLADGGASAVLPCVACHGDGLRGSSMAPPLAGRAASYVLRQLLAFRTGARSSTAGAPMRAEAATLTLDDMIAVSAYAASLQP